MNTPSPITPPTQDPDVLKAQLTSLDAQLVALDYVRLANLSSVELRHIQQKSNLLRQKATAQAAVDQLTKAEQTPLQLPAAL